MKTAAACFIFTFLFFAGIVLGQSFFFTNNFSPNEAIRIAQRLKPGMKEEDVVRFLSANKLHSSFSVGSIAGWDAVYVLTNGVNLNLDYSPRKVVNNGRWGGNGLLQKAYLQSNGVTVLSISLTNAP